MKKITINKKIRKIIAYNSGNSCLLFKHLTKLDIKDILG
jgi:hypothetical protein